MQEAAVVAAAPAMGRTARSRWVGMVWEVAEVVQAAARSERVVAAARAGRGW